MFRAITAAGQRAAVKLFRGTYDIDMCRREFALAATVDPTCTAAPLSFGRAAGRVYLATEYLPGYRCGNALPAGGMPARQLGDFAYALARVLAVTHECGVVHCDVKPGNLLVRAGDVRLIDFGIARTVGEPCGHHGIVPCSRGWAAPEQLRAEGATPAVDVFAWGCVVAYLATGVHPFASENVHEWVSKVLCTQPDLASLPIGLRDLVTVALNAAPGDRPTADELAANCAAGHGRHRRPRPDSASRRRPHPSRGCVLTPTASAWGVVDELSPAGAAG